MEYYSAIKRSKCESVELRWMNLEPVIQSEVSQKEKNILMYIYLYMELRKKVLMNLSAGKGWKHRPREGTCGQSWGKEWWDELRT